VLDTISKLLSLFKETDEEERCGVVLKSGRVVELRNVAPDPKIGFRLDPAELLHWLTRKRSPAVATWHTHPGQTPNLSEEDYAGFLQWPDLKHYIVGVKAGRPTVATYEVDNGIIVAVGGTV
jgi:proteasome lid subunit RPN8/RPN11